MKIEFITVNNTPVFCITQLQDDPQIPRIYGATYDKQNNRWLFPAFPPFIHNVLYDFDKVYSSVDFSIDAQRHIENLKPKDVWVQNLAQQQFLVPNFDHQLDGLADVLYNYRWILHWEMGTGKTKVIIEAIKQLQCKALILCPLIALNTWKQEAKFHSGDTLKTLVLNATSKQKKINLLSQMSDYDLVVVTYDTARIYGMPRLLAPAVKALKANGRIPNAAIKRIIQPLNDPEQQEVFIREWMSGASLKELAAKVQEQIQDKPQWLMDFNYQMIVADESHRCKDISSLRTKAFLHLVQKASRRILLTGTLSDGDPRSLYPQLKALANYLILGSWWDFCERHLIKAKGNDKIVVGYRNLHILNAKVDSISSRKKLEDCVSLPERRFETIDYELTAKQRKDYNRVVQDWVFPQADDVREIQNGAIRIDKLLQICSGFVYGPQDTTICDTCPSLRECVENNTRPGALSCIQKDIETHEVTRYPENPKLKTLSDKLLDLLPNSKIIIWARFTQELDDIEEELRKHQWGYVRVDGKTTKNIQALSAKFNTQDTCVVYLGQISTGISVTLNAAKYAFYYSRSWSIEDRQQSLARNYRIGQSEKTIVYDLCAQDTIEQQQLNALQSKETVSKVLTEKVTCALCSHFMSCLQLNIVPWTPGCVLSTKASRVIAQARII